jgi:hypothetical protein
MNFSKLKLKDYLVENASGVEVTSNNPAARNSQASGNMANAGVNKQIQGTVNNRAAQTKQSVGQTTGGQGTNSVVRKKSHSLADTQMNTDITSSYDATKANVELIKLRESSKSDWRQELMEAANPNDDPDHPFVEVMPFNDFRMKEAQGLMKKAAAKDKMAGGVTNMSGMKEEKEVLTELAGALVSGLAKVGKVAGAAKKSGTLSKVANVASNLPSGGGEKSSKPKKSGPSNSVGVSSAVAEATAPVTNYDNTATPAENKSRRVLNAVPQMKGTIGKKVVKGMETDAISGK